jgi:alpha-ketoglutarate-dependent taurine dioxygenase
MKNIEQDVCDLLNKTPNYAGLLEVVNGAFDPESFVADSSSQLRYYSVAPSSDGTISVIQGHQEGRDKSQRSDSFDYHTDGVYRPQPPALFMLACENPGTANTSTVFLDSRRVVRELTDYLPILGQLQFTYTDKRGVDRSRPMLEPHPLTGELVMHSVTLGHAEPLSTARNVKQSAIDEAMLALDSTLRSLPPYRHSWKQGDVVIADNQAYLHARVASAPDPLRKLGRVWLDYKPS